MSRAATLAYLAGAMDSDGCISVKRSTYAMRVRGDAGAPVFSERVMFKQVTPEIPTLLKEMFGGSFRVDNPSTPRGRKLYSWQATDLRAVECLRALLPYLRVKRAQAENCLALRKVKERSKKVRVAKGRGHAGGAVRPLALTDEMEALFAQAKAMNSGARA